MVSPNQSTNEHHPHSKRSLVSQVAPSPNVKTEREGPSSAISKIKQETPVKTSSRGKASYPDRSQTADTHVPRLIRSSAHADAARGQVRYRDRVRRRRKTAEKELRCVSHHDIRQSRDDSPCVVQIARARNTKSSASETATLARRRR